MEYKYSAAILILIVISIKGYGLKSDYISIVNVLTRILEGHHTAPDEGPLRDKTMPTEEAVHQVAPEKDTKYPSESLNRFVYDYPHGARKPRREDKR